MHQSQRHHAQPNLVDPQATLFVRMSMVIRMTGLGRSTIYRLIAEDKFPCQVRLAKRAVAWRRADLELWSQERQTVAH
jgi:prophage regulatory protein